MKFSLLYGRFSMCLFEHRKRLVFSARCVSCLKTRHKRCRENPAENLFDDFVFQIPPLR